MKIEVDFDEFFCQEFMTRELKELMSIVISDDFWETEDRERDLEAIERVLAWYDCGT